MWGLFPLHPSSPHSRNGLHGHRRRPKVNLPLCCHGNGRAEKKGRKPGSGELQPGRVREESSGVESVFSCVIVSVCMCLTAAVFLKRHTHPLTNTHTETHAAVALVRSWTSDWSQHYSLALIWQSAVGSTSHKEIFIPTQLASSKMEGQQSSRADWLLFTQTKQL